MAARTPSQPGHPQPGGRSGAGCSHRVVASAYSRSVGSLYNLDVCLHDGTAVSPQLHHHAIDFEQRSRLGDPLPPSGHCTEQRHRTQSEASGLAA